MATAMGHGLVSAEWMSFSVLRDQDSTVDLYSGLECAALSAFQESAASHCGLLIDISRCEQFTKAVTEERG